MRNNRDEFCPCLRREDWTAVLATKSQCGISTERELDASKPPLLIKKNEKSPIGVIKRHKRGPQVYPKFFTERLRCEANSSPFFKTTNILKITRLRSGSYARRRIANG